MKRCFAVVCASLCCAVLTGCESAGQALRLPENGVAIDGTSVPYVRQDGRTYLYLKDLEENGFYRDYAEYGWRLLPADSKGYYFILWTEDCHRERKTEEQNTEPPRIMPEAQNQIYINGLQITCYALGEEPLIDAEELAGIGADVDIAEKQTGNGAAVYYNAEGISEELRERIVCISPMAYQTLDGEPETPDCFCFESCSDYLVSGMASADHGRLALHVVQKGEMLETAKGDFPLEGIYAGQSGGIKAIEMTDDYAQFSNALERMGLSYGMEGGMLKIEGEGSKTPCQIDQPEAVPFSPYYHMRMIKTKLDIGSGKTIECIYSGSDLYVSRKDLRTKKILEKNGYIYKDYVFLPKK